MATTAKDLIEAAWGRSTANDPISLATRKELIGALQRKLKQVYSLAIRRNPFYFAKSSNVVGAASKYAVPTDAEAVIAIEDATGGRVHIVPFFDKKGEQPPRVYRLGRDYISVGEASDPGAADTLTFVYGYLHADLDPEAAWDDAANTLEADWPEQFNDIMVVDLAQYLAIKDGVRGDLNALAHEEEKIMAVFEDHLDHAYQGTVARFGHSRSIVNPTSHVVGRPRTEVGG